MNGPVAGQATTIPSNCRFLTRGREEFLVGLQLRKWSLFGRSSLQWGRAGPSGANAVGCHIRSPSISRFSSGGVSKYPNIALLLTSLSDPEGWVQERPFLYYSREAWATTPVTWLLFVLALVGLRTLGAGRLGTFGRIGTVIGITGAILIGVGDAVIAAVPLSQGIACVPPTCTFYDPRHFAALGRIAVFAGVALFLVGMILYGITALQRHTLAKGWGNALPLFLGALGPLSAVVVTYKGYIFYTLDGHAIVQQVLAFPLQNWDAHQALGFDLPSKGLSVSIDNTMPIRDLAGIIIASFICALSWIALGKMMWPGGQKEPEAQVQVVEPTAS